MNDKYDYWNAALDHSGKENMTEKEAKEYCEKTGIEPYLLDFGERYRNKDADPTPEPPFDPESPPHKD